MLRAAGHLLKEVLLTDMLLTNYSAEEQAQAAAGA